MQDHRSVSKELFKRNQETYKSLDFQILHALKGSRRNRCRFRRTQIYSSRHSCKSIVSVEETSQC